MIKVTVKCYGEPAKVDKEKNKVIKHIDNYTISENISSIKTAQVVIKKEVTKIFKKYKGIYCIKFYV